MLMAIEQNNVIQFGVTGYRTEYALKRIINGTKGSEERQRPSSI
jgi:hypothetical protein